MGKDKGNRRVAVAFFAVLTFGAYIGDARHASDQLEGAQVGQDVFISRQAVECAIFEGGFERRGMGAVPIFREHDRLTYLRAKFVAHGFGD